MAFQKVFDFKEITIEYASNGTAVFQFYSDMPGGTLAVRLPLGSPGSGGFSLPSTGGITIRKTITIPLDGVQGTQYYPIVTPGNTTQIILLQAKIWLRPIGVYLDGSLSEIWQTQPIAVGA
jgi:hypothetical protein